MVEAGEGQPTGGEHPRTKSVWDSFDRELADINATLERLQKDLPPPSATGASSNMPAPRRPRRPRRISRTTATALVAAPEPPAEMPKAQPALTSEKSVPPAPTGTDLADPKSFGLMPPIADLEPGTQSPDDFRKRLAQHLAFANKVLHTSRVPASVWREWRAFEKAAQERLRALAAAPTAEPPAEN